MFTDRRLSRRAFLGGLGLAGVSLTAAAFYKFRLPSSRAIPGSILGASAALGHRLRDNPPPPPSSTEDRETVIVGGGIAGLSAAWWLERNGHKNFRLLELEQEAGGNSRSGRNEVSAYPWAAHYVPLPTKESTYVRELFEELGVITGYQKGLPVYNEYYLCADPHERLFIQGQWQDGLVPQIGITEKDKAQYKEFFRKMNEYKLAKGRDGRAAFAIPVDASSSDPLFRRLDTISMDAFLKENGWDSRPLHWYVNYCCRDDYGRNASHISAWAGVHYFASRSGAAANADSSTVLTWPEGNGWIVNKLREKIGDKIQSNSLVFSITEKKGLTEVDSFDPTTNKSSRIQAKNVIFAAPRFVAARVIPDLKEQPYLKELEYAPWMVANVTLKALPTGRGAPLSWDNVSYYGNSLGYVVATHQNLALHPYRTVVTFFLPLDEEIPATSRRSALERTHAAWANLVAENLEKMHPGIRGNISNIDVMVWGHGMISPSPGFLWGKGREQMKKKLGAIRFAHSDMSGVSIFEEAQFHGVEAAKDVLRGAKKA